MIADFKEKQRRDRWAILEYAKEEGMKKGQAEVRELMEQGYSLEQIKAKLAGFS
jgi:hypothetical protein